MDDTGIEDSEFEPDSYVPDRTTFWNQSWNDIYDHFADAIRARANAEGLNEHSQDDVLQEVMVTIIRFKNGLAPGYDPKKTTFRKWFWGVIHNRIREVRRRDRKQVPVSPNPDSRHNDGADVLAPEAEVLAPEDFDKKEAEAWARAQLANAMRKVQKAVSPQNFSIYTALFQGEATPEELAVRHNITRNAVDAANFRCRQKMKVEIEKIHSEWEKFCQINTRQL